ncbi:Fc receptor-like protein 5 [Ahaetulla prasina]|uniref:Fc receptor-like protein 5 n=1 Tax=Ahaetulla prasina TaxID=499056 RepID=UPI002649986A|nr:Fc receptor-like protein 5 [Ahaetulla prasina]
MDRRVVQYGSHHWEDGLKVSLFSWASLVPIIDFVAVFWILPICLQMVPCESTTQDFQRSTWNLAPAAPILSWSPSHRILVKGEYIELKCSPPEGQEGENYFFDRMNVKGEWKRFQEQIGNTLLIPALRMAPKATFSCSYTGRNKEGRTANSRKSNWGEFSVIDCSPAPILSPDPPEPVYLVGENVVLWCSIPNLPLQGWRRYQFSHIRENEKETSIKDLDWHEGNVSLVLTATREDSGLYKCRYLEWKYERNIPSEWSRPVSIMVRDPLLPPVLELNPSSGSLGILSILCLSRESNNTKRFHFSQDSVEMASSNEEPLRSSRDSGLLTLNMSVAFLYAKDNESLRFACRYEENINGRWIMSPWSETLNTTVASAPFALSVGYAGLVLLVPFLAAPLVFCWCRRNNKHICARGIFTF